MEIEIPVELLSPTIEELEQKTARDMETKWKPCKRPGKKERCVLKQEKDNAKLKTLAKELDKPKRISTSNLSTLFAQNKKNKFSLNGMNTNSVEKSLRPTLRVSLVENKSIAVNTEPIRKRGRPPKVKPI
jgi:hypothetical protein